MFRRLASVAALALVGGIALAGCQAAPPSVAAQIGDFRITNERVDQIVNQIDDEVAAARQTQQAQATPSAAPTGEVEGLGKDQIGDVRATIVQLSVFDELSRRIASDKGLTLPAQDYKASASQIGLSENNPYIKLAVDADAYRTLLLSKAQSVTPTEADLREAYRKVVASGGSQVGPYDQVRPQLLAVPELGQGLGLRSQMLKAAATYGLVVNPRYEPLEMPLTIVGSAQSQIVLVSLPLGASPSPAVRDLPSAAPSAA
jgi:hypothetical protein